jgi:hypothetical protein
LMDRKLLRSLACAVLLTICGVTTAQAQTTPKFDSATIVGAATIGGALTLGASGPTGQRINGLGTANMVITLGGPTSILNFISGLNASILQLNTASNSVNIMNQLTLPGKTWVGSTINANASLFENSTWTGAPQGNVFAPLHFFQTNEGIDTGASGEVDSFAITANTGIAGFTGNRHAGVFTQSITAAPTGKGGTYTALNSKASASVNVGGTNLTPSTASGFVYANNPVAILTGSALNFQQVIGQETDVAVQGTTTVMDKIGQQIVDAPSSVGSGFRDDVALSINGYAQGAGPGWSVGLEFGRHGGGFPMSTTGTMIMTSLSGMGSGTTVQTGLNFLGNTITKWALATPGFSVDGTGNVQIGTGLIGVSASGMKVDAPGAVGTGVPAVVAGGTGYIVGDIGYDTNGGIYKVASLTGTVGAVATVTVLRQPFFASTTTPTNPVAITTWTVGQAVCPYVSCTAYASGLTLTIGWNTSLRTVQINPSGGPVQFGSGAFSANAAVATTMTSLGPTGSHTTVQEWLQITDAAGTVRYIPAY